MRLPQQNENENISKITVFRRGYISYLNSFLNLANGLMNYLSSGNVSEQSKRELIPFRKDIDQNIIRTTKLAKDLILELDDKHMVPASKKEIPVHFRDAREDTHRLAFVSFYKTFESLRNFHNVSKEAWTNIQYTVLSANLTDQNFKSDAILQFRVLPILDSLESLKIFLERMAKILAIQEPHLIFKQKRTEPVYSESGEYKLSSVFREGLQKSMEEDLIPEFDLTGTETLNQAGSFDRDMFADEKDPKKENSNDDKSVVTITRKVIPSKIQNSISTGGNFPWNSNQHYYFRYEQAKYEDELKYFVNVINMDTHLGADSAALRKEMIRNMTSRSMKNKSSEELEGEYYIFLDHFFEFCRNILLMGMGVPDTLKYLFFFHIGPSHFYMIVKKFLQEANTGYLHVRSQDGKKVSRLLPGEIIKKHVISFWLREIMPNVGDEKNNLSALKKIIEIVDLKYKEVSQYAIREFDALAPDEKMNKPRVQIFREKMNLWMGAANIIVFKRFLKTSI